jgi:hypothetical protein
MSTQDSALVSEYVADYECLMEGVIYLWQLEQKAVENSDMAATRNHYKEYPEDNLCHIYRPGTRDMILCRRAGIDAIERSARRLVDEAANSNDLSTKRIAEIIRENVFQIAIDNVTDDEELVRLLKSYIAKSETEHVEACYHFPCVLLHYGPSHPNSPPSPPEQFELGPVNFRRFQMFVQNFTEEAYRLSNG